MRIFFWLVMILLGFACSDNAELLQQANRVSQDIKEQMAPDGREAIYKTNFYIDKNQTLVVSGETSLPEAKLALFSALEHRKIHLLDSMVLLPEKELGDLNWALVNLSVVNLRSKPKHSAELVSQAIMGTPVRVLKKQNSWYLIQTPDNYIAWVDRAALAFKTKEEMKQWRNSERVVFIPWFKLERDSIGKDVVTDLVAGSILELKRENSGFYWLTLPDGREIMVVKRDCELFNQWEQEKIEDASVLTKIAKQFMGRPYLWGGTSSKGVDCSGFVKSVYFMHGIILARDASLQFLHGDTISPEQGFRKLKEGDLVFFGRKATSDLPLKVTHVGMYMKDGEFIHSSGRVKINSFDSTADNYSDYRSISWLGGRRVLNRIGEAGVIRVAEHPWY
ncbi:C40 family peptidase [Ancylomarina longa]|nr:C40 family peptidase [Ancylomarina longa]